MKRAQKRSVSEILSYGFCAFDEFVFGYSAKHLFAEKLSYRLHFSRNGGVIVVEVRMASARVYDIKRIAVLFR